MSNQHILITFGNNFKKEKTPGAFSFPLLFGYPQYPKFNFVFNSILISE